MRRFIIALLAAGTLSAPALAHEDRYDRHDHIQRERDWRSETARAQHESSQRILRETARAQHASSQRILRETARAQNGGRLPERYDRYDRYDRRDAYAMNDERAFRRFADRNRDGRVSRAEYAWAADRW